MKHISVKYMYLQDAITNQEVWLRRVGTKNMPDGLTQTLSQQVPKNMLITLISKLTEPPHEYVSINMITAQSIQKELMDAQQNSTLGALGVKAKCRTHQLRDTSPIFQKKGCADRGGLLGKVGEAGDSGEVGEVGTVT